MLVSNWQWLNFKVYFKNKNPGFIFGVFYWLLNTHIMIFESPDGGKTVFARPPHIVDRIEVTQESLELNNLWFAWRDILTAARHNPGLKEALDRAQVIYELSRHET